MANFFDQEDTTEEQALLSLPTKGTGNFFDQEDTTEEQAEVESGEWLSTDTYSTAMSTLQGFTLGWSDEAIVGMGAANNTENYAQYYMEAMVMEHLDSPASTTSKTYQVQLYSANSIR